MLHGLVPTIFLGILWSGVAVVVSRVARRPGAIVPFYVCGLASNTILSWTFLVRWPELIKGVEFEYAGPYLWIILAGILNSICQFMILTGMTKGHMAATWALTQSSPVLYYAASILLWDEKASLAGIAGILILVLGIAILAGGKHESEPVEKCSTRQWAAWSVGALLVLAFNQTLLAVPSHTKGWTDPAQLRLPLFAASNFLSHLIFLFFQKIRIRKEHVRLGIAWSILSILSFILLFHCLDIMSAIGRGRLVFPIGTGVCILGFSLYSLTGMREKYSRFTCTGIALVLVSLLLLIVKD